MVSSSAQLPLPSDEQLPPAAGGQAARKKERRRRRREVVATIQARFRMQAPVNV
jgi:hypothetical protein